VSEWYHVYIFTASISEYADPVVDCLDNSKSVITRRYFREVGGIKVVVYTTKRFFYQRLDSSTINLTKIEPDLSKIILIDNSPICFEKQPHNGILIDSWIDDPMDTGLLELLPFLDALRFVGDVRSILQLRK
jgi:CTD nuclear envelope phosphatase 1